MFRRALALGAAVALLTACANRVRYSTEAFEHPVRDVVSSETIVDARGKVLTRPRLELALSADETTIVRRMRTKVKSEEYTPYRSGPETWEVAVGVLCLPAVGVMNGARALGLGFTSEKRTAELTTWSLTAANPLMNLPSDTRVFRNEVSRESEELDRDVRREARPLAGERLALALDPRSPKRFTADARGRVSVELLTLVPADLRDGPRLLRVSVDGEETREPRVVELPLSPELSARLARGARLRAAARAPGASPETVGRTLAALTSLGFGESAVGLESELRARAARDRAWLARLDDALGP
jgi:hypothetical protein